MFKLIDLQIGSFAIVKEVESQNCNFPMNIHGILRVMYIHKKYVAVLLPNNASEELEQSGELETLKKKAIELTEEAVADEISL